MLPIFNQLEEILVDDETDNKTDHEDNEDTEQPETTVMPDLETEESDAQKRTQKGQGLKILTPQQMLTRLTISLAQSKLL